MILGLQLRFRVILGFWCLSILVFWSVMMGLCSCVLGLAAFVVFWVLICFDFGDWVLRFGFRVVDCAC